MGQAEAQLALYRLAAILEAEGLPYAIIGAFALNEYGHKRVTVDVDLVMREEHLSEFKRRHLGNGYAERVAGTGKLLDTLHGVNIDVLSTGRFPGDDKPKPIAFPDPATVALRGERFSLLPMARFIELKLASGMVAAHRGKDLVDVQELIKSAGLPASVGGRPSPLGAWKVPGAVAARAGCRSLLKGRCPAPASHLACHGLRKCHRRRLRIGVFWGVLRRGP